jgi:hypothetical protein
MVEAAAMIPIITDHLAWFLVVALLFLLQFAYLLACLLATVPLLLANLNQ